MFFQHEFKHKTNKAVQDLATLCKEVFFKNLQQSPIDMDVLMEN